MNNLFQRNHSAVVNKQIEENNLVESKHVSNGLENFGVEGEMLQIYLVQIMKTEKQSSLLSTRK